MSSLTRQNTLFVAEDWLRIYEAMENVDFRAYDFDNLVQAMRGYLALTYPENFNDWIASSEFVSKLEILAWLSQNIAFRVDLNARENFLATAERRDSLIRLAQNIGYKVNRVRSAQGLLKMISIRTTQEIYDATGANLKGRTIYWNDVADEDWFERIVTILNNAFAVRTPFGNPISQHNGGGTRIEQYILNSGTTLSGAHKFTAKLGNQSAAFDICNAWLEKDNGILREVAPNPTNAFSLFYQFDGGGFGSTGTGFMVPFKQGHLAYQDEIFDTAMPTRTITLTASNVNNDDFFVQRIDDAGNVIEDWEQVDTVFGEGVNFNTLAGSLRSVYEVDTLANDQVRIRFGDGTFGRIPVGRFRFWYRAALPTPMQIPPSAIRNQSVNIAYFAEGEIHQLTMTFSLQQPVSNGSRTETNDDIRTRAGRVFYTQNRMITAQDYNNFFLKDTSILKVKTVNRIFTGQSRYSKLTDPTGLYQGVRHTADDGRLYRDDTISINDYTANTDLLPVPDLIEMHIKPLIRKTDKTTLFYNQYLGLVMPTGYTWMEDSEVNGRSRGRIMFGGTPQAVGTTATGIGRYVDSDAIIRLEHAIGDIVVVDRVTEDGTALNGVTLRNKVPSGTRLFSVLPLLRNRFTVLEYERIQQQMVDRNTFALGWNQQDMAWNIIHRDNIDPDSPFSMLNQGDDSGTGKDASWLVYVRYVREGSTDYWRITDRGEGVFFESAREVKFLYNNDGEVIDPVTGRTVRDSISLLRYNETRNSLARRGLRAPVVSPDVAVYTFVGDGVVRDFQTTEIPLDEPNTVVVVNDRLQVIGVDFQIVPDAGGYFVRFHNPPEQGSSVIIYYSSQYRNGRMLNQEFVSDGTTEEYDLGVLVFNPLNVMVFIDGIMQNGSLDYGISHMPNGTSSVVFNEVLPPGNKILVYLITDIDNPLLVKVNHRGDGVVSDFEIPAPHATRDELFINIDGIIQDRDRFNVLGVNPSGNQVVRFSTPPGADTRVRITTTTNQRQIKTRNYRAQLVAGSQFVDFPGATFPTNGNGMIVAVDGVVQSPQGTTAPSWSVVNATRLRFATTWPAGTVVTVWHVVGSSGTASYGEVLPESGDLDDGEMRPDFLGADVDFIPIDTMRHQDGYTNPDGVMVAPLASRAGDVYEQPIAFNSLVITDGRTDLVLWRKSARYGYSIFEPITPSTVPRGTHSVDPTKMLPGDELSDDDSHGDIHYNVGTDQWLIADGESRTWVLAPNQAGYKKRVGRPDLSFKWTHYSTESRRIDPSVSNVMNVYILSSGYDAAYRDWIRKGARLLEEPVPETTEQLRIQYSDFEQFKAVSDAIIFYPARYKPLFGGPAKPELRANFKIVQTQGSKLTETDLKLRVLAAIDQYFDVTRWEFGEKFFFTELVAFVHAQVAPDLQSMIVVPRETGQTFGRMFQVRSEPDELFISAATVDDIQVVPFFTDSEMRIGASL